MQNRCCHNRKRFISNEEINSIIKIIKSLEQLGVLIYIFTETLKYEKKKKKEGFLEALLALLATSIVQPIISSVVKGVSGRGFRKAGRGYMNTIFEFISIL